MTIRNLFYSYGLKCISIVVKLFLVTLLIKEFSLGEYGTYSYFLILTGLFVFLLGGDFYNYTHRNIASLNSRKKRRYYISQHMFYMLAAIIIFTTVFIIYCVFFGGNLYVLTLLFLITISEYLITEYYRYLIIFGYFDASNLLLFVKTCGWVVVLLICYYLGLNLSLKVVLSFWFVGLFLLIVYLIFYTRFDTYLGLKVFSYKAMKIGFIFSLPFFFSSILYKLNEFLDRFYVERYLGVVDLGVYSVFYSFIGVIQTFVFVGVLANIYPKLIAADDVGEVCFYLKKLLVSVFLTVMVLSTFVYVVFDFYVEYVGQTELLIHKSVFLVLLVGNLFFCMSLAFHYVLLRAKESMKIFYASLISICVNLLCLFFILPVANLWFVSLSFVASMFVLLFVKFYYSLLIMRGLRLHEQ